MNAILALLILAAPPQAPMDGNLAETVRYWEFEAGDDINFDRWPDHWTRRRGSGYPLYTKIGIVDPADTANSPTGGSAAEPSSASTADSTAKPADPTTVNPRPAAAAANRSALAPSSSTGRYLSLQLDGGAVAIYSPPVEVSPLFSYVLQGSIRTRNLKHDAAFFEVRLLNKEGKIVETHTSTRLTNAPQWTTVRLGPLTINRSDIRSAVIGVHLRPTARRSDLFGEAAFDNIWFGKLPRMQLRSTHPFHVFEARKAVQVECEVSGIDEKGPVIEFELFDRNGRSLARQRREVVSHHEAPPQAKSQAKSRTHRATPKQGPPSAFSGTATWQPPIPEYGFYRIRASLRGSHETALQRMINLAVVHPQKRGERGEFGWTLPRGEQSFALADLAALAPRMGIHWLKFPVWYGEGDQQRADELAWLTERLGMSHIRLVGVLDQPPPRVRELYTHPGPLPVASIFLEPQLWQAAVDPVMTRLSLKVQWWQLGADNDTSFVGFPNLEGKIEEIRKHLERFGQEIRLGMPWRWINETPTLDPAPWEFLSLTVGPPFTPQKLKVNPPFTSRELRDHLEQARTGSAERWVVLRPLSADRYDERTRARDLVSRMLAAKMQKASGIFLPDPFNDEFGVMQADGQPGPMLLPWRTTSLMIAGSEFIGSLRLPSGSRNYLFARGNEAIMVVWNDTPTEEALYLGRNVRQVDLWGRSRRPDEVESKGHVRQKIRINDLPSFITGVNLPVARWRMAVKFNKRRLSSAFGRQQAASFTFQNYFPQGVGGRVRLHTPKVWDVEPREADFKLATSDERRVPFKVLLRADASSGEQPVRIDFNVTADRNYKFSVYRSMEVGLGDLTIDLSTSIDGQGNLVVEQVITNQTDRPVSFNCLLFVPNRRRERKQVFYLARGRATATFILANGEELIGKTLFLRAEEIGGNRILNYNVKAER